MKRSVMRFSGLRVIEDEDEYFLDWNALEYFGRLHELLFKEEFPCSGWMYYTVEGDDDISFPCLLPKGMKASEGSKYDAGDFSLSLFELCIMYNYLFFNAEVHRVDAENASNSEKVQAIISKDYLNELILSMNEDSRGRVEGALSALPISTLPKSEVLA